MDRKKRLVIADSHTLVAEALKHLLQPEFEVVGIFSDGRSLVQAAVTLKPDAVILEVSLPQLSGLDAAENILRKLPSTKFLFATANTDPEAAAEAFRRGALAYVPKHSTAEELLTAIRKIFRGESYLSSLIARETMDYLLHPPRGNKLERRITPRQTEILQLLAEGKSMKEVAQLLDISPGTVAFHKYTVMERLGIQSNAELLQYAITKHLAPVERSWTFAIQSA